MQAGTSACKATASICLAASRTISSSTEPLASLGSASSWTTLSMGVPSRPARQRRHMIRLAMGYLSSSGRCAPSRHPAEDHPQVLIIAPTHLYNAPVTSRPAVAPAAPTVQHVEPDAPDRSDPV